MRKILLLLTIVVILPIFTVFGSAEDGVDGYINDFEAIIPDGFEGLVENSDSLIRGLDIRSLFTEVLSLVGGNGGIVVSFFLKIITAQSRQRSTVMGIRNL